MLRLRQKNYRQEGSTLAMALMALLILAFSASTVFYYIGNRYQTAYQSGSWNEALVVSESGVDLAMQALNNSVGSSPSTAWNGWNQLPANANPPSIPITGYSYSNILPQHTGDGNNKMYVSVTVDLTLKDGSGNVWPKITSLGTTEVPGLGRVGYAASMLSTSGTKNHNNLLRKITMSYSKDVTGHALHVPQTTRTLQVIAQPQSGGLFKKAMVVQNSISMSGGSYVDSFNSSDPTKSTNGQYDQTKRQNHGDVASNSSGGISDLKNAYVYGNASSNGGTIKDTTNVQGTVYNNFATTISPVSNPSFSTVNSSVTNINLGGGSQTITAGTAASPQNFVVSQLNLSGSSSLILSPPAPGQDSYINIWVQGDLTTSGSAYIKQMAGVHATIWVTGKVDVSGGAFDNENGYASYLTINGVTAANGSTNTYNVSGQSEFIGVVDAPSYALNVSGSGDFVGAMIMYSATLSGSAGFHYDEVLAGGGSGSSLGYTVASWIEDIH